MVKALNRLFLALFLLIFVDNFGVYSDKASHLAKIELVF
jgi:hypothetical protein